MDSDEVNKYNHKHPHPLADRAKIVFDFSKPEPPTIKAPVPSLSLPPFNSGPSTSSAAFSSLPPTHVPLFQLPDHSHDCGSDHRLCPSPYTHDSFDGTQRVTPTERRIDDAMIKIKGMKKRMASNVDLKRQFEREDEEVAARRASLLGVGDGSRDKPEEGDSEEDDDSEEDEDREEEELEESLRYYAST